MENYINEVTTTGNEERPRVHLSKWSLLRGRRSSNSTEIISNQTTMSPHITAISTSKWSSSYVIFTTSSFPKVHRERERERQTNNIYYIAHIAFSFYLFPCLLSFYYFPMWGILYIYWALCVISLVSANGICYPLRFVVFGLLILFLAYGRSNQLAFKSLEFVYKWLLNTFWHVSKR